MSSATGARILVVDDEAAILRAVQANLGRLTEPGVAYRFVTGED